MTLAEIALLATAFGVGTILTKLVDKLLELRKGRIAGEQSAWERADSEARHRRELEETLHQHRQLWHILHDTPYEDMPPVPEPPKR